jgi:hypothetical protein
VVLRKPPPLPSNYLPQTKADKGGHKSKADLTPLLFPNSLIQLGFSGLKEKEIAEGVELLCKAWF